VQQRTDKGVRFNLASEADVCHNCFGLRESVKRYDFIENDRRSLPYFVRVQRVPFCDECFAKKWFIQGFVPKDISLSVFRAIIIH
jgi:hypothetical protein